MDNKKVLIEDDRLTPDLERVRKGGINGFRNKNARTFDSDFELKPPSRHYYAELIDGLWYWVNGCPECNGEKGKWAYIKCEKHNVCVTCSKKSKDTKIRWGHEYGFECNTCRTIKNKKNKARALAKVAENEYDEYDFHYMNECKCPHCATVYDDIYESEGEQECEVCGGKFSIEVDYTPYFSTTVIGERVTE